MLSMLFRAVGTCGKALQLVALCQGQLDTRRWAVQMKMLLHLQLIFIPEKAITAAMVQTVIFTDLRTILSS